MGNMRFIKNNSIAKAFLICLLILSLIGCMAGCNQKTDADAPVRQSEGWAEKSFRKQMADASVTEVVISDPLVLASPVEVAGNKVISGEASITAIAKNMEGDYMFVVPSGNSLTVKGSVTIDAAGVMGGVHIQKDATWTLEENATVKNASAKAANALVEGKLLLNGGTLADANGHNIYNKNETVISGGTITGSGEQFAGVYNEGKLTQDDGSICAAYYNVVSVDGSSYTFNKGSVADSVNNAIVIEKGASLKITSKDASVTGAGYRGIYLSGEAVIDQVSMKNSYDTLIKVTKTGKLTVNDGTLSDAGYHGIDNAGTLLVNGGTIYNSYSCGIVNTGSLEMTGGSVMNNPNKGILNKLNGVAKVTGENVYLAGNMFAIGNEDEAYFELTAATFSGSTNANIYAYGGEMYIHDIKLAKSASNNVRVVAAKVTMENVEILGNATTGSSTMHGLLLEGGSVEAKDLTIIGTTGNGIRNKGGKFVGTNVALRSIGNHGVTNTNQDFTGREGVVIIDGLTVETVRYNNILSEKGTMTLTNAVLTKSGTNNIKVSGGTLNLVNVDVQGNIAEAADNVHGIYTTGGTINGTAVRISNTRGAALRVDGDEALVSIKGFTAEALNHASVSLTKGTVSITDGVVGKTDSNNIRIDGGALTLKNVTVNGHVEGSANNIHGVYATGGKLVAEDLTVAASSGAGIRSSGGNVQITGLKVDNVGTHTLYITNDKSVVTVTNAALGVAPSNNVVVTAGALTLTDSEILGQVEGAATNVHGILTGGGKVNLEAVTITGTSGSGIRNKGAILNGTDVVIENFGGYNALSNAASDSGLCGELNIDGLTVSGSLNENSDLVILSSQCDGKVNISNAKFTPNSETVKAFANVVVDAGTVVLDNIQMEVVTSNSVRVNGGNVTLTNSTIPGHVEGSANNVNAFYTVGGTTHLENITITNPTGDGLRVNLTADEEGEVTAEPTVTAKNVTVTGAGRNSVWVSGGELTVEGAAFSGLKSNLNNVLVSGGKATLINVVSDKVNKNNNICVNGGEMVLQDVQILGHNEGAGTSNHGVYANGGKLTADGLVIQNCAGSGIRVDNDTVVDAKDVKISVTGQHGIRLGDVGEEASNDLKVTINGLTIENTTTNNILHENGELTVKNAVLHESTSNNIKLIGGKLNLENVQVLGHKAGVRNDNHGIFVEITKNSNATLNAKDILVSNTAGAALRNKGGNVTVDGLVLNTIGATTLISNVDWNSVPAVMTLSRVGISEGCEHATYAVHNQISDTKLAGTITNELTVKDSIMPLGSKTIGIYVEYGKATVENSVITGAVYAIQNKAELTVNGGSLHNNGWSVRNEEGAKATLSGGFYYGNKEGTLPSDIYNGGDLTIEDITVGYNKKGNGRPGVIYQAATATPITMKGKTMGLHEASKKLQLAAEEWVQKWGPDKNIIINCDSVADALEAERFFDPGIENPKMFVSAVGSNLELTTQPGGNYIVQIGTERFESFKDALAYIAENDAFDTTAGGFKKAATIQIIDSYLHFENIVIPEDYNITLVDDGTGEHTVAYDSRLTGDMFTVGDGAQLNLKVTGNTNPASGLIFSGSKNTDAAVFCVDGGVIILESDLNITNAYYGIRLVDGEFNAAGKTINTAGTYGIHAIGGELYDATLNGSGTAICVSDDNADAQISNVTITGYGTGIYGNNGKLTVDGLTGNAATYNVSVGGSADITVSDAAFGKTTSNNIVVNGGKLTLTDATIEGHVDGASDTIHSVMAQGGETTLNNVTINHAKNSGVRIKNNGTVVNINGAVISNVGNDGINITDAITLNISSNLDISDASNGIILNGAVTIKSGATVTISDTTSVGLSANTTGSLTMEDGSALNISNTGAQGLYLTGGVTASIQNVTITNTTSYALQLGKGTVTGNTIEIHNGKQASGAIGVGANADADLTKVKVYGSASNTDYNQWNGKVKLTNAEFSGTVYITNGELTLNGAVIDTTKVEENSSATDSAVHGIHAAEGNPKVVITGNLTIRNAKHAIYAEKGQINITGTKDGSGNYSVQFSDNFKNLVVNGNGKINATNVKLGKTSETNVEANGTDSSIVLENADVLGTNAYNAVAAQGGDITLTTVTISGSKTAGIRVNDADSSVIVNNVTVSTAGTIGVSMKTGSLTVEDNGEADKASLVITNATTRGIEITDSGELEILDDVTISHTDKKSWAVTAKTGGKITAADGTKITIRNAEYGLYSTENSIISLDEVDISGVKTNSIYVDGNANTDVARTGVTVKRGTIGTTESYYNVHVMDGGKLSLSNATVTSTSTVTTMHGIDVNATIHLLDSASSAVLDKVTVIGGMFGIRVHAPKNVTLNDVTIQNTTSYGLFLQSSPLVTVTGELKISDTGSNGIQVNSGTLDASNATKVEIKNAGQNGIQSGGTVNLGGETTIANTNKHGIYLTDGTLNVNSGKLVVSNFGIAGTATQNVAGIWVEKATVNLKDNTELVITMTNHDINSSNQVYERAIYANTNGKFYGAESAVITINSESGKTGHSSIYATGTGSEVVIYNAAISATTSNNVVATGTAGDTQPVIKLYNSSIAGGNYCALAENGTVYLDNVTVSGGATANLRTNKAAAKMYLKDVTSTGGYRGIHSNNGNMYLDGIIKIENTTNEAINTEGSVVVTQRTGTVTIDIAKIGICAAGNATVNIDDLTTRGITTNSVLVKGTADVTISGGSIGGTNSHNILIEGADSTLTMSNVTVAGHKSTVTADNIHAIYVNNADAEATLTNVTVNDTKGDALRVGAGKVTVTNLTINSAGRYGMFIGGESEVTIDVLKITGGTHKQNIRVTGGSVSVKNAELTYVPSEYHIYNTATMTLENVTVSGDKKIYNTGTLKVTGKIDADIFFDSAAALNVVGGLVDDSDITLNWADGKLPTDHVAVNFVDANSAKDEAGMNACKTADYIKLAAPTRDNYSLYYMTTTDKTYAMLAPEFVMSQGDLNTVLAIAKYEGKTEAEAKVGGSFTISQQVAIPSGITSVIIKDKDAADSEKYTITYSGTEESGAFVMNAGSKLILSDISIAAASESALKIANGAALEINGNVGISNASGMAVYVDNGTMTVNGTLSVTDVTNSKYAVYADADGKINGVGTITISGNANTGLRAEGGAQVEIGTLNTTGVQYYSVFGSGEGTSVTVNGGVIGKTKSNCNVDARNNATVTVKNAQIQGSSYSHAVIAQSGGDVKLENVSISGATTAGIRINNAQSTVTLDGTVNISDCKHGISMSHGNVIINGTATLETATDHNVVIESGGTGTLTVIGVLNVNGNSSDNKDAISVSGGEVKVDTNGHLNVNSAKRYGVHVNGGKVTGSNIYVKGTGDYGVFVAAGTLNCTDLTIENAGSTALQVNGGSADVTGLVIKDHTKSHSIKLGGAGTLTINGATIGKSGSNNINVENNGAVLNLKGNVTIAGTNSNNGIILNKGTLSVEGKLTIGDTVGYDICVQNQATAEVTCVLNVSGELEVEDIRFNAANTLNVTGNLTGDVTIDWASGKAPTGTAISFASEDVMNASMSKITLGNVQSDAGNLLYFHMDGTNAVATLVNKVVTSEAELNDYLAASAYYGTSAEVLIGGNFTVAEQIELPAGLTSVTISDKDATDSDSYTITYNGAAELFKLNDVTKLTVSGITIDGNDVSSTKPLISVPTDVEVNLTNVKVQNTVNTTATGTVQVTGGTLTVDGATFTSAVSGDGTNNTGVIHLDSGVANMKDTAITNTLSGTCNYSGVYGKTGTLVIENVTIEGTKNGIHGYVSGYGTSVDIKIAGKLNIKNVTNTAIQYQCKGNFVAAADSSIVIDGAAKHGFSTCGKVNVYGSLEVKNVVANAINVWYVASCGTNASFNNCVLSNTGLDNVVSYASGTLSLNNVEVGNTPTVSGKHQIYTEAGSLRISGKVDADIYYAKNADKVLNVIGALTAGSDVTVDWASGKAPTGTAISFASEDVLNASKDYISLGTTQKGAGKYLSYSGTTATLASGTPVAAGDDLQTAITNAASGDVLILQGDAYTVSTSLTIGGKELTLLSAGDNTTLTVASGVSPFTLASGDVLTLENLTVGGADGALAAQIVVPANATLNLKDSTLQYMTAASGGAVNVASNAFLNATGTTFSNNFATTSGGAIDSAGLLVINDCIFYNNSAANKGGAIRIGVGGTHTISNCTFVGNKTTAEGTTTEYGGGAIMTQSGPTVNIVGCVFESNTSATFGGALKPNSGTMNVTNCVFGNANDNTKGNSAYHGGAIYHQGSNVKIYGSKFYYNSATKNGGAIYNRNPLTIDNYGEIACEFVGNNSGQYGGAIYEENRWDSTNNKDVLVEWRVNGATFTANKSTAGGAICNFEKLTVTNCVFTENEATASSNGGGAIWSSGYVLTVENSEFTSNKADLGGAILSRNALTVTETDFKSNTAKTKGGAARIESNAATTFTDCDFISNSAPSAGAISRESSGGGTLNFSKCNFEGNFATTGEGGAMLLQSNPSTTIDNCTFTGNTAKTYGGAIKNNSVTNAMQINNSTFTENSAESKGGAIYDQTNKTYYVTGCTFANNTAGDGNAIHNAGTTIAVLSNGCTFNGAADPSVGQISGTYSIAQ